MSLIRRRAALFAADADAQKRWADGGQFEPAGPHAQKLRCVDCRRTGYGLSRGPGHPSPWQVTCLLGHAPCPTCGRLFTLKVSGDPQPHGHHRHVCVTSTGEPGPREALPDVPSGGR